MKLNLKHKLLLLCIVFAQNFAFASTAALEVENAIVKYLASHPLNATYLVAEKDEVLSKGSMGYFSFEKKKHLEPDQIMPIASGTKPMTAAAILRLNDKGLLKITDTVAKHLPASSKVWPNDQVPEWAEKITLHQLLTHTSGLAEYIPGLKIDITKEHHDINKEIVKFAVDNPLQFTPGKEYRYCNTGFVMLGLIIENVSKKSFGEFLKSEFFDPLKMKSTFLVSFDVALKYQQNQLTDIYPMRYFAIPTGKEPQFVPVNSDFILSPFADGGVISNVEDLYKWNTALHEGRLLSEASYTLMTTPYVPAPDRGGLETHMGYGLFISKLKDGQIYYNHGGNALAIRSEYGYLPELKAALMILSNVMVQIPEDMTGKVNMDLPANQIDIIYFRNAILDALTKK
ncbi:MAG: serine hydrolase domain-containing protein [Pseudomonadota bacterium]